MFNADGNNQELLRLPGCSLGLTATIIHVKIMEEKMTQGNKITKAKIITFMYKEESSA